MSFRVVRTSKFRHVYGTALKREQCYDNIRVSKSSWDSTFCSVNPKFLAIIVESAGGGAFIVLPHHKVGRINPDHPLVGGHKGPVLDIAWCPHNDNVIASGSEDCVVKVWQIPDGGLSRTMTDPVVDLLYHQRRVGLVLWHPTALNVLLTAGSDNQVVLWNVGNGEVLLHIDCHPDIVYSACFDWDGSKLVTTCKDKKIRIINPRTGEIESEALCHEGSKATQAIFLRHGLVFTTGFNRSSERQYSLRAPDALKDPIVMVELDTSNGVMFPLYDPDTNMIFLCGKGDSVIRYFEVTPEPPFVHYINTHQSPDPQRGIGMMPKRGCDVSTCEIAKFYRLTNNGLCQIISMTVPRRSELFQEDLYPDTVSDEAANTAEEWMEGKDAEPILVSLKGGYVSSHSQSNNNKTLTVSKKANILAKIPPKGPKGLIPGSGTSNNSNNNILAGGGGGNMSSSSEFDSEMKDMFDEMKTQLEDMKKQSDEMRKLKSIIVKHENRIRALEAAQKSRDEDILDTILSSPSSSSTTTTAAAATATSPPESDISLTKTSDSIVPGAGNLAPDEV